MSASIYYRVVTAPEGCLDVATPSKFLSAMQRAFGEHYPWRLNGTHIQTLQGMAAGDGGRTNPYQSMVEIIQREDGSTVEIEVWPEY